MQILLSLGEGYIDTLELVIKCNGKRPQEDNELHELCHKLRAIGVLHAAM
jgi:hypothetical protein